MRKRSSADGWVEDGVHRKNPGHEEERGDIDPSLYHSLNATGNPHYQLCSPLLHGDVWYIEQIQERNSHKMLWKPSHGPYAVNRRRSPEANDGDSASNGRVVPRVQYPVYVEIQMLDASMDGWMASTDMNPTPFDLHLLRWY